MTLLKLTREARKRILKKQNRNLKLQLYEMDNILLSGHSTKFGRI